MCRQGKISCAMTRCNNTSCAPGLRAVKQKGECCFKCVEGKIYLPHRHFAHLKLLTGDHSFNISVKHVVVSSVQYLKLLMFSEFSNQIQLQCTFFQHYD